MYNLAGKVVLVTGAGGGIGQALCRTLAAQGCRLALLSRTAEKLHALAASLRSEGADVAAQLVDLRDRAAVENAVTAAAGELGAVDVLIHNAGVGLVTRPVQPELDGVEEMMQVNYLAGVYTVAAVLPAMLQRGSGHLVAVGSLAGLRGMAWTAGYSASKAALATWLESLRPALRRRGILTTTCHLGFVRTALSMRLPLRFPLWMISPESAARGIVRAIRAGRREVYFPWYDALAARLLRRLPAAAFDGVMANFGRFVLKEEY